MMYLGYFARTFSASTLSYLSIHIFLHCNLSCSNIYRYHCIQKKWIPQDYIRNLYHTQVLKLLVLKNRMISIYVPLHSSLLKCPGLQWSHLLPLKPSLQVHCPSSLLQTSVLVLFKPLRLQSQAERII